MRGDASTVLSWDVGENFSEHVKLSTRVSHSRFAFTNETETDNRSGKTTQSHNNNVKVSYSLESDEFAAAFTLLVTLPMTSSIS